MMKKKKHLSEHLSAQQFVLLSGLVFAGVSIAGSIASEITFRLLFSSGISWRFLSLAAFLPSFFTILASAFLYKYQFGWKARPWIIASLFGTLVAIGWNVLQSFIYGWLNPGMIVVWLLGSVPALLLSTVQYFVLRRYIQRAWLWIVSFTGFSLANYFVYSTLYYNVFRDIEPGNNLMAMTMGGLHGMGLAIVLSILVRMTINQQRQQFEDAEDEVDEGYYSEHYSEYEYQPDEQSTRQSLSRR